MKKFSEIIEGHTSRYDLSNSKRLLEEAMEKINMVREEFSKLEDADVTELEEGWNLIDRYYGNLTKGQIFKRRKKDQYIPNISAKIPERGF